MVLAGITNRGKLLMVNLLIGQIYSYSSLALLLSVFGEKYLHNRYLRTLPLISPCIGGVF